LPVPNLLHFAIELLAGTQSVSARLTSSSQTLVGTFFFWPIWDGFALWLFLALVPCAVLAHKHDPKSLKMAALSILLQKA
jgi:Mn2+/Fe2+ NRAMP family transporter